MKAVFILKEVEKHMTHHSTLQLTLKLTYTQKPVHIAEETIGNIQIIGGLVSKLYKAEDNTKAIFGQNTLALISQLGSKKHFSLGQELVLFCS